MDSPFNLYEWLWQNLCYNSMLFLNLFLALLQHDEEKSEQGAYTLILKVHKIEKFFGSDFEFFTISLLVMFKY